MSEMFKKIIEGAMEDGQRVIIKSKGEEQIILPYEIYDYLIMGYDLEGKIESFVLDDIENVKIVEW